MTGEDIQGDNANSSLAYILSKQLVSYRGKLIGQYRKGTKVASLRIGGPITAIIEDAYPKISFDEADEKKPAVMDIEYLHLKQLLVGPKTGEYFYYSFKHPNQPEARVRLPNPSITSFEDLNNIRFIIPDDLLLSPEVTDEKLGTTTAKSRAPSKAAAGSARKMPPKASSSAPTSLPPTSIEDLKRDFEAEMIPRLKKEIEAALKPKIIKVVVNSLRPFMAKEIKDTFEQERENAFPTLAGLPDEDREKVFDELAKILAPRLGKFSHLSDDSANFLISEVEARIMAELEAETFAKWETLMLARLKEQQDEHQANVVWDIFNKMEGRLVKYLRAEQTKQTKEMAKHFVTKAEYYSTTPINPSGTFDAQFKHIAPPFKSVSEGNPPLANFDAPRSSRDIPPIGSQKQLQLLTEGTPTSTPSVTTLPPKSPPALPSKDKGKNTAPPKQTAVTGPLVRKNARSSSDTGREDARKNKLSKTKDGDKGSGSAPRPQNRKSPPPTP